MAPKSKPKARRSDRRRAADGEAEPLTRADDADSIGSADDGDEAAGVATDIAASAASADEEAPPPQPAPGRAVLASPKTRRLASRVRDALTDDEGADPPARTHTREHSLSIGPATPPVRASEGGREFSGLTASMAHERLVRDLDQLREAFESRADVSLADVLRSQPFLENHFRAIFASVFLLVVAFCVTFELRIGLEVLFLIFTLALSWLVERREQNLAKSEVLRRLESITKEVRGRVDIMEREARDTTIPDASAVSMVRVFRNGVWRKLPPALLVEGDLVELAPGDRAPGDVEAPGGTVFMTNEIVQSLPDHEDRALYKRQRLRLLSTPCIARFRVYLEDVFSPQDPLSSALGPGALGGGGGGGGGASLLVESGASGAAIRRPKTSMQYTYSYGIRLLYRAMVVTFWVSLTCNLIRFAFDPQVPTWTNFFILRPIYTLMPLFPPQMIFFYAVVTTIGNARVAAHYEVLKRTRGWRTTDFFDSSSDEDEDDESQSPQQQRPQASLGRILFHFRNIVRGRSRLLLRTTRPVETLGSITALCCADKHGILADPDPTVEKILLCEAGSEERSERSSARHMVLDLSHDPSQGDRLRFEDIEWRRHINVLKPLGLGCLLNQTCARDRSASGIEQQRNYMQYCRDNVINSFHVTECLCQLVREIGFSDDAANTFRRRKEIHTFASAVDELNTKARRAGEVLPIPYMMSLVVEDNRSGSLQLLSRGTPDLILRHCSSYFDGTALQTLDSEMAASIYETYHSWSSQRDLIVVALSYAPVTTAAAKEYLDQDKGEPRVLVLPEVVGDEGGDGDEEEARLRALLRQQIFIGMVGLRAQPKEDSTELLEDLQEAGVRFVYFSTSNEVKTLAFGEKLGLETDWNCCISLDNDERRESLIESDIKAQLPRGVGSIRKHLEDVDNVPLLVRLFAGSDPEAAREMVRIFQENGDIVCAVGSSLNLENTALFSQAEVAIGLEPESACRCLVHGRREEGKSARPGIDFASSLTCLPALLCLPPSSSLGELLELLRFCRHLLISTKQCVSFLLFVYGFLVELLVVSFALMRPPVLDGLQVLWVVWVAAPLVALPVLVSPPSGDVMKLMAAKHTQGAIPDLPRFLAYLAARTVGSVIVLMWVFSACMGAFWEDASFDSVVGTVGDADVFETDEYRAALIYSQSVTAFFFVLYASTMGINFLQRTTVTINGYWAVATAGVLGLQAIVALLSFEVAPVRHSLAAVPIYVWAVACCWPAGILAVDGMVKHHDRKRFNKFQKRTRLEFNTRLGMHSPV